MNPAEFFDLNYLMFLNKTVENEMNERKQKMNSPKNKEINDFINELWKKDIPIIIEYNQDYLISKFFFKPPQKEWIGIGVITEKDKLRSDKKYRGLLLTEKFGIITLDTYDVDIHKRHWNSLRIEDLDIYVENAMNEVINRYKSFRCDSLYNKMQEFNLETDIILKDCLMDIYCRQQSKQGVKLFVM